ncbi:MAG: hypothetical protein QF664_04470, partial [Dehalococcoidia bacterium]|nr:hypothetical protein [Dehalococcoidia bacterium]
MTADDRVSEPTAGDVAQDTAAPNEVTRGDTTPGNRRPERLLVALRLDGPDGQRYVFARWEDWPHPAMLS